MTPELRRQLIAAKAWTTLYPRLAPDALKRCTHCGMEKPLSEFITVKARVMSLGKGAECLLCHRAKVRAHGKVYRARPEQRRLLREWERRRVVPPEKTKARDKARAAVRYGKLERANACQDCGASDRPVQGHHEDYSKPLDVVWLCVECHGKRHRKPDPGQEIALMTLLRWFQ